MSAVDISASQELLSRCLKSERQAQFEFYDNYAPKMFGICLRYAKSPTDAEDILQEGFIKIFKYLADFRGEGSLEGWMRRIMVTTSLNFYKRKNLLNKEIDPEEVRTALPSDHEILALMTQEEILKLVQELPTGYRTVFNLNTIEGYSHKEIGEIMNISVNTSKSQLSRAKSSLQDKIRKMFSFETASLDYALFS